MNCRHCNNFLENLVIDLGNTPPSNAYIKAENLNSKEVIFPLRIFVCEICWLVQTEDFTPAESLFEEEYAYFSSYSSLWLEHSKKYVSDMIDRLKLNSESMVVEVAANDGYLLQYIKDNEIPCYGIEPTSSTANAARIKGIEIVSEFFGKELAIELVGLEKQADLIVANNVLAHVPNINDFLAGFSLLLKPDGVATFEFPHLCNLMGGNQFDTIYHEHFSYLSLTSIKTIFEANELEIIDVQKLTTHGGSLRVFAQRLDTGKRNILSSIKTLLSEESNLGVNSLEYYHSLNQSAQSIKNDFINFLNSAKNDNKKVIGYGAAAKGNTLLNYCGVENDLIEYVVDKNPHKQGMYLPGSKIPIVDEAQLKKDRPNYIIIFPWNLAEEIIDQLKYAYDWKVCFVTTMPNLTLHKN